MAAQVTLLIKGATIVPSPNLQAEVPKLTLTYQTDQVSELSSDKTEDIAHCTGAGMVFDKKVTLEKITRSSSGNLIVSFSETGARSKASLGTGKIKLSDLIKHGDFATSLRDQAIVLKHAGQACPIRVDVTGGLLDGAMVSLDVELLSGSKIDAARAAPAGADDTVTANVYLCASRILATRGAKTDSFARVMLVVDGGSTEHEIGRTEVVADDLSPEYNAFISLTYSASAATKPDSKTVLRFEVCDPGAAGAHRAGKKPDAESFTVIGAGQQLLSQVHAHILAGKGSGINGLARMTFALKQKGQLQGLIKEKVNAKGEAVEKEARASAQISSYLITPHRMSLLPWPSLTFEKEARASAQISSYLITPHRMPLLPWPSLTFSHLLSPSLCHTRASVCSCVCSSVCPLRTSMVLCTLSSRASSLPTSQCR